MNHPIIKALRSNYYKITTLNTKLIDYKRKKNVLCN